MFLLATSTLPACSCSGTDPVGPGVPPVTNDGGTTQPNDKLALSFESVPFDTGLSYITDMTFAPDSDEFMLADLYGGYALAKMTADGAEVVAAGKIDDVFTEFDAGQLAIAIDPEFADNSYFYLAANRSKGRVVVRRYTLDREDEAATVASGVVILEIDAGNTPRWHNISSMGFEPDGTMWLLVGDKGLFEPAQDPTDILGTLMRILPSKEAGVGGYTTPEGAPKYSPEADDAVYAIGVRSPWKGILHDGRWYYGEVGLDDFEEINVIDAPGRNFGWPEVEGLCAEDILGKKPDCDAYDDPWIVYGRSSSHTFVLEDVDAVPTSKRSTYVGWIHQAGPDPYDGLWDDVLVFGDAYVGFMRAVELDKPDASWHLGHMPFPSAWMQAPDGYVYVATLSKEPDAKDPSNVSGRPSPLLRAVPTK